MWLHSSTPARECKDATYATLLRVDHAAILEYPKHYPCQSSAYLNGLLFIEKLDWDRVKKLGGKFLQLHVQDLARRYSST